jgi:hypothetical protein
MSSIASSNSLWRWQLLQALLVVFVIRILWDEIVGTRMARLSGALILGALVLITPLGLESSYLMPDFSGGLLVCTVAMTLALWQRLQLIRKVALILLTSLFLTFHLSHLPIAAAMTLLYSAYCAAANSRKGKVLVPSLFVVLPLVCVAATLLARNAVFLKKTELAPKGGLFLFARFFAYPLKDDILAHCEARSMPTFGSEFCRLVHKLPSAPGKILWDVPNSPMAVYRPSSETRNDNARLLLRHFIAQKPFTYLRAFLHYGAQQVLNVDTDNLFVRGISICTVPVFAEKCDALLAPRDASAVRTSKQALQTLPFEAINRFYWLTYWAGLGASIIVLRALPKSRDDHHVLGLLLVGGVIVNAFVAGGLSATAGRYQLRVAWIPLVFAVAMIVRHVCDLRTESKGPT